MKVTEIKRIWEYPEYLEKAAIWFSQKWEVPLEAYRKSMQECIGKKSGIPQWYFMLNEGGDIIAGAGPHGIL